jgi:putative restriction endonuclease
MTDFDAPVFKILANNDTGAAKGHQGGLVVPKALEQYFPRLSGEVSAASPTLDAPVTLELWVAQRRIATVQSRYQFQTWGGERSPERRLTSGFSEWRNEAKGGDLAIFQRSLDDEYYYRLTLVKAEELTEELKSAIAGRKLGVLYTGVPPTANAEIDEAERQLLSGEDRKPLFTEREQRDSLVRRPVRSYAFRGAVIKAYEGLCAVTGEAIFSPSGASSSDAAHIIPVEAGGADVLGNGICLRKDLHWAFDNGLWTISRERKLLVSPKLDGARSRALSNLAGSDIKVPNTIQWQPDEEALNWHMDNRFLR